MSTLTMEHLLNGVAEETNNSPTDSASETASMEITKTEPQTEQEPETMDMEIDSTSTTTTTNSAARAIHMQMQVPVNMPPPPRLDTIAARMPPQTFALPKLPPISSLTHPNGVPPSMQLLHSTNVGPTSALPGISAQFASPVSPQMTAARPLSPAQVPIQPPATSPPVHGEHLCRYRNKLCLNPRAIKRNGELHNLCEKHRAKANQNQRKLESKRRLQKKQTRDGASSDASRSARSPSPLPSPSSLDGAMRGMSDDDATAKFAAATHTALPSLTTHLRHSSAAYGWERHDYASGPGA